MKVSNEDIAQRVERFEEICRKSGVKLTHQRLEIFREVAQSGDHPDAETVFEGVRKRLPTVSLDTVYRTLWLLKDLSLITTMGPSRERTRFDANLRKHHHFVCTECGLTQDFYSDELDALEIPQSAQTFGHVTATYVEVRGICHACSEKEKSRPDT